MWALFPALTALKKSSLFSCHILLERQLSTRESNFLHFKTVCMQGPLPCYRGDGSNFKVSLTHGNITDLMSAANLTFWASCEANWLGHHLLVRGASCFSLDGGLVVIMTWRYNVDVYICAERLRNYITVKEWRWKIYRMQLPLFKMELSLSDLQLWPWLFKENVHK